MWSDYLSTLFGLSVILTLINFIVQFTSDEYNIKGYDAVVQADVLACKYITKHCRSVTVQHPQKTWIQERLDLYENQNLLPCEELAKIGVQVYCDEIDGKMIEYAPNIESRLKIRRWLMLSPFIIANVVLAVVMVAIRYAPTQ